jgi:hypothetical protein
MLGSIRFRVAAVHPFIRSLKSTTFCGRRFARRLIARIQQTVATLLLLVRSALRSPPARLAGGVPHPPPSRQGPRPLLRTATAATTGPRSCPALLRRETCHGNIPGRSASRSRCARPNCLYQRNPRAQRGVGRDRRAQAPSEPLLRTALAAIGPPHGPGAKPSNPSQRDAATDETEMGA